MSTPSLTVPAAPHRVVTAPFAAEDTATRHPFSVMVRLHSYALTPISLCRSGWSRTFYLDQASPKLTDLPASVSRALGPCACPAVCFHSSFLSSLASSHSFDLPCLPHIPTHSPIFLPIRLSALQLTSRGLIQPAAGT